MRIVLEVNQYQYGQMNLYKIDSLVGGWYGKTRKKRVSAKSRGLSSYNSSEFVVEGGLTRLEVAIG